MTTYYRGHKIDVITDFLNNRFFISVKGERVKSNVLKSYNSELEAIRSATNMIDVAMGVVGIDHSLGSA
jgi:hypothetical protein